MAIELLMKDRQRAMLTKTLVIPGYEHYNYVFCADKKDVDMQLKDYDDHDKNYTSHGDYKYIRATKESGHNGSAFDKTIFLIPRHKA